MANLTIINQEDFKNQIAPKVAMLKTEMNKRIEIWEKMSPEKKKKWITGDKDPIMSLAYNVGQYLKNNFPELLEDNNG